MSAPGFYRRKDAERLWREAAAIMKRRSCEAALAVLLVISPAAAQWTPANSVTAVEQRDDGIWCTMQRGVLIVQVCTPSIFRIRYIPDLPSPARHEYVLQSAAWEPVHWTMRTSANEITLETASVRAAVGRPDGTITFSDSSGKKLFEDWARTLTPVQVNGESTYHAEMFSNLWGSPEGFYGLGQHQAGVWNYRGESVELSQDNTNISIPLFFSSNGYGIFWNSTARSRFNNRFLNALYLSAEVSDGVDYFFIYGPQCDSVIAAYRRLTGDVPLFGKWAYGFWQCKNRYKSQSELLAVARKYRSLGIPLDNVVQDWFWWNTMGEPVFDASRYPDPKGMVDTLHALNIHLMISVWPYFRPGSATYAAMDAQGFFIDRTIVAGFHPAGQALYDAYNPRARAYYWNLMDTALFRKGVDAWWLDTTEPETEGREANILLTNKVAAGSGARYVNLYPLMTATGVYEGQRLESSAKRVFILSRSAFAGSQHVAAAVWSGDINSDWVSFKRQIPAGLNYCLSGLPYWTTDTGGFVSGDPGDSSYRELFIRWFQFSTFTPILRVHGTRTTDQNELWSYGPRAQNILCAFDRLRYRLLPYIYSLAWMITGQSYTSMRALVMDFRTDVRAANVGDQFMFGPALLVSPVLEPGATHRWLYLPDATWYDFWNGRIVRGPGSISAPAPLEQIPLFVRAGSILPMGPDVLYSTEKPPDPIELRVYRGADGQFALYDDENDSYDYERGLRSLIPIRWNDSKGTLTFGAREGRFPGMLEERTFRVVFVTAGHGTGLEPSKTPDRTVRYHGESLVITYR